MVTTFVLNQRNNNGINHTVCIAHCCSYIARQSILIMNEALDIHRMFCTGYCDNDNENVVIGHNSVNLKVYNKNIQLNMLILK